MSTYIDNKDSVFWPRMQAGELPILTRGCNNPRGNLHPPTNLANTHLRPELSGKQDVAADVVHRIHALYRLFQSTVKIYNAPSNSVVCHLQISTPNFHTKFPHQISTPKWSMLPTRRSGWWGQAWNPDALWGLMLFCTQHAHSSVLSSGSHLP